MTERLDLTNLRYEFTRTGIVIEGESTKSEWELQGEALVAVSEALQWTIGDWLVDGKRHYGDGVYKRASEITGYSENVLRQFASLSTKLPEELLLRNNNLTYSHHKEVAPLKPIVESDDGTRKLGKDPDHEKMAKFLQDAERNQWTVVELRKNVREYTDHQNEMIRLANEPEKFTVVYADPPWQYTSGDQHGVEQQSTTLIDHYPTMPLQKICEVPVDSMAAKNAVLFVWVTSPMLEEAFQVINAWGFSYKTSMVWDKVLHNVGHYVSVRHEMLLICTRGRPPKVKRLAHSVYQEERTEHSRKPEYFYELIEELYPSGKRIELFARKRREGWAAWGNEVDQS